MPTERDRMYGRWHNMLARCECPDDPDYHSYGGRGIRVCERWHNFQAYLDDIAILGPRPGPGYSVDRRDNDGNYEPGNVRWATATEQAYNSRGHLERKAAPVGERYGRLIVLSETDPIAGTRKGISVMHRAVLCGCECGMEVVVKLGNLKKTTSCGCLKRERMRVVARQRFGSGGTHYRTGASCG